MAPKRKRKEAFVEENKKGVLTDFVRTSKIFIPSNDQGSEFSVKKCEAWFHKYAEEGNKGKIIGPDGIEQFCKDLGVDPNDIVMLVVAWKLSAENMGFFKLSEWKSGMTFLGCDSLLKLKSKLDGLRAYLKDTSNYKKIYRYAFDFCRDKDQRSLDIETGKAMLSLLLRDIWPQIDIFLEYLNQTRHKVINRDQWNSILEFIRTVDRSFTNYDVEGAWPVLLDEFVEYVQKKDSKLSSQQGQSH
eukprot:Seg4480.1 transcript_id=Seg4480.1/GoldUCD/mRNA.D3Y31 product="DCN1-like protein 5" protein_id=Seg4480.1/GoldUCD/D3Y31